MSASSVRDDVIRYSAGHDLIFGGDGRDTYNAGDGTIPSGAQGRGDVAFFGGGVDTADYQLLKDAVTVVLDAQVGTVAVTDNKKHNAYTVTFASGEKDVLVEVENVLGTKYADRVKINSLQGDQSDADSKGIDLFGSAGKTSSNPNNHGDTLDLSLLADVAAALPGAPANDNAPWLIARAG